MIFLDMDGVLADFVSSTCKLHNRPVDSVDCWGFNHKWGISDAELWLPIHEAGHDFWANLEPYPWLDELIRAVELVDPKYTICTTPSLDPRSCSGKLEWIHKHIGHGFRRYVMACDKSPLAAPGRLLIDDGDHNCEAFHDAGGEFICFPQPWNLNRHRTEERMKHTTNSLGYFQKAAA